VTRCGRSVRLAGILATVLFTGSTTAAAAPAVFVTNQGSSSVSAFTVGLGGALVASGAPVPVPAAPDGAVVSPDGKHLYVALLSHAVAAFSIGAAGALTSIPGSPYPTGGTVGPFNIAMTPDGTHLYAANFNGSITAFDVGATGVLTAVGSPAPAPVSGGHGVEPVAATTSGYVYAGTTDGNIYAFKIAADGSLSALAGSPYSPGGFLTGMAVAPDQSELFVTSDAGSGNDVYAFMIGPNGELTAVTGSPFSNGSGNRPRGVVVSPDGSHLYVAEDTTNSVTVFSILSTGALSEIPGSPFPNGGTQPIGAAINAAGTELFVADFGSGNVAALSVGTKGTLSPISGSPFSTGGTHPFLQSVAVGPDQGPHASLSVGARPAGSTTLFNASGSTDVDGTVSRYDWSFGDGATLPNGGPTPAHVYTNPGLYTVAVTTTDDAGCSSAVVFTGQSVLCNGSPSATATATIGVVAPPTQITQLKLSPAAFVAAPRGPTVAPAPRGARKKHRYGTVISYRSSQPALTTFTVQIALPGRAAGRHCVKPSKRYLRRRRCTRYVTVGTFIFQNGAGVSRFRFAGRLNARKLRAGTYRLLAAGTDAAGTGPVANARFQVNPRRRGVGVMSTRWLRGAASCLGSSRVDASRCRGPQRFNARRSWPS
jgi:6-phosphogluconolactonase (cycloisomerase 2 family)